MSIVAFQKRMAGDAGRIHWKPEHYSTLAKVYKISEDQVARAVTPPPVVSSFPEAVTKAAPDVQRSFRWTMNDGELDRAARNRRAELRLVAGMSIDEHTAYLNAKAERKEQRRRQLEAIRGRQ